MRHLIELSTARQMSVGVDLYHQVGALCYRVSRKGRVKVLLVTSRGTGRWIIPKGWPMEGLTSAQSAAQEAWEEAGVRGEVLPPLLGQFTYKKIRPGKLPLDCLVDVFALRVEEVAERFPERGERLRDWLEPEEAARHVSEPGLAALLRSFAPEHQ